MLSGAKQGPQLNKGQVFFHDPLFSVCAMTIAAAATPARAPGSASRDICADLLAGLSDIPVERNRKLAAIADSSRIAGQVCEGAYDPRITPIDR